MEAEAPRDGVEQVRVLDGNGDDVGDVELEEVDVVEDGVFVGVADEDEDEEGDGDEVGEAGDGGCESPHSHDSFFSSSITAGGMLEWRMRKRRGRTRQKEGVWSEARLWFQNGWVEGEETETRNKKKEGGEGQKNRI